MCIHKIKKSYRTVFEKLAKKYQNTQIWPFRPWKMTFRAIQPNQSFDSSLVKYTPWEASCLNRDKVIKYVLRKFPPSEKWAKFDLSDLQKWHLARFNQIHIFTVHWYHPKESVNHKRIIVINRFWEIILLSEKLTPTTDHDDGRISIRKAPLPFGWWS